MEKNPIIEELKEQLRDKLVEIDCLQFEADSLERKIWDLENPEASASIYAEFDKIAAKRNSKASQGAH